MLSKIRIRNFRSISDLSIDAADLSILIGKNDTGKSNILRALNLFFNNQTDFRTAFDFDRDFSRDAKTGQGKAPEIRIDLHFIIPTGYKVPEEARFIEWTKRWRSNDFIPEDPVLVLKGNKKESIGGRSKLWNYINNIDYHYIPALKGREYFSELLSDIYDVLSDVSEDDLLSAAGSLQNQVEVILNEVAEDLKKVLQGGSVPKLPQNLRSIFRLIQFESDGIDLDRRGDGIRVRHVPSLMKFLCDLKSKRAGHYQILHLWGLEEPENSVDFISAFELRDQILDIAKKKDFQIFMSTHSPVFFKLEDSIEAKTIFFKKDGGSTCISSVEGDVADEMGVLRVVSPYVEESRAFVSELRSNIEILTKKLKDDVLDPSRKVVFVEGPTDEEVLELVSTVVGALHDVKFVSSINNGYSSANAVVDNLIAWHHLQKSREINRRTIGIGIVDHDMAGESAKSIFAEKMNSEKSQNSKIITFRPNADAAKRISAMGFIPKMTLERFAPLDCWKTAFSSGWLEQRSPEKILGDSKGDLRETLLNNGIKQLFDSENIAFMPYIYDVKIQYKKEFANSFSSAIKADGSLASGFLSTFKAVKDAFSGSIV